MWLRRPHAPFVFQTLCSVMPLPENYNKTLGYNHISLRYEKHVKIILEDTNVVPSNQNLSIEHNDILLA